jgi:hypothetical protein
MIGQDSGVPAAATPSGQSEPPPSLETYRNDVVRFALSYPSGLKVDDAKTLQEVIERGHRATFGNDPQTDPDHEQALKCTHVFLSASIPEQGAPTFEITDSNHSPPIQTTLTTEASIFVAEIDRSCLPGGASDEQILQSMAATPLQFPGFKVLNPQMWYEVDKHRVHLGSASGIVGRKPNNQQASTESEQIAVAAASFAQNKHLVVVMLTTNNPSTMHLLMQSLIQFGNDKPTPLMPFAIGNGVPVKLVP